MQIDSFYSYFDTVFKRDKKAREVARNHMVINDLPGDPRLLCCMFINISTGDTSKTFVSNSAHVLVGC